jgi:hypothetical protein
MSELDDINEQIAVLQERKRVILKQLEDEKNKPFIDVLGQEIFDFLNNISGFGPTKMKDLCSLRDVTAEDIKSKFRILKGIDNAKAQQIGDKLRSKGDATHI